MGRHKMAFGTNEVISVAGIWGHVFNFASTSNPGNAKNTFIGYLKSFLPVENRPLIAIADDQRADRLLLKMAFAEAKLNAEIAEHENGPDLVEYVQKCNKSLLKLIILDIQMPKQSGIEVLEVLKQNADLQHIPVMVFSTSSDPADSAQSLHLGAVEYIKKPHDLEGYLNLVNHIKRYLKD
jgi:CheY-like chemotaxis protein